MNGRVNGGSCVDYWIADCEELELYLSRVLSWDQAKAAFIEMDQFRGLVLVLFWDIDILFLVSFELVIFFYGVFFYVYD